MVYLLKMVIFHGYVKLPEGIDIPYGIPRDETLPVHPKRPLWGGQLLFILSAGRENRPGIQGWFLRKHFKHAADALMMMVSYGFMMFHVEKTWKKHMFFPSYLRWWWWWGKGEPDQRFKKCSHMPAWNVVCQQHCKAWLNHDHYQCGNISIIPYTARFAPYVSIWYIL